MIFFTKHNRLAVIMNICIPLFFLSLFLFKGSYNVVPLCLAVFALGVVIHSGLIKQRITLPIAEKRFVFVLCFYMITALLLLLFHQDKLREFEYVGKLCLLLPLFYLFYQAKIQVKPLLIGILLGSLLAGGVALYDRFYLNVHAAYSPRMLQIQAGDMAMSLGAFSFVISVYYYQIKRYPQAMFSILATLFGMLGSFLSTARGGWIGIPVVILMVVLIYRRHLSKRWLLSCALLFILAMTTAVFIPKTKILQRVDEAYREVVAYAIESDGTTSVGARLDMWKGAILMAKEKPLLGWGIKGVAEKSRIQAQEGIVHPYVTHFHHAHNQYLDTLAKHGLIGLASLLLIFLAPLGYFLRQVQSACAELKVIATLGAVHIVSVMCYSMTQAFLAHNSGNLFYFFLLIVFYSALSYVRVKEKARHN